MEKECIMAIISGVSAILGAIVGGVCSYFATKHIQQNIFDQEKKVVAAALSGADSSSKCADERKMVRWSVTCNYRQIILPYFTHGELLWNSVTATLPMKSVS